MRLFTHHWPQSRPVAAPTGPLPKKIVLLHGMGGTGALWRPLAASLEESFEILAPDQRGHGRSRVPASPPGGRLEAGYTPLDYGKDLVDTLAALEFHPTWVLGHSMGVRSACALAQLRPDWVEGLILIDLGLSGPAGGGLGENLSRLIRVLPERFESRAAARAFLEASSPDLSIARYLLAVLAPAPEGDGGVVFPFDAGALLATIEGARDVPVRHWVQAAAERGTPALLLRGAESQVWSKEDFEAEKAEFARWPHVQFVEFSGTGHGLPFEKRSQLKQAVQAITTHPHDPLPAH